MAKLALVRHGQSQWNLENRFTGWVDVPLTDLGRAEAERAGNALKAGGYRFTKAYTSVLKRAEDTLQIMLGVLGQQSIPIERDQALNERHYGDLQGLNKAETAEKFGDEQVHIWRRSYDVQPPGRREPEGHRRAHLALLRTSDPARRAERAKTCSSPPTATACARS